MNIGIRPGRPEDIDWLLGQLKNFSDFFGTKLSLFGADEDYSRFVIQSFMSEPHVLLIAEKEDVGPIGFVAGIVTPHLFNPAIKVLAESFWWVDEAHRGSRAGLMLLNDFIAWGKTRVDWITFALEEKSPVNEKALLKRGFRLQERSYLMEIS